MIDRNVEWTSTAEPFAPIFHKCAPKTRTSPVFYFEQLFAYGNVLNLLAITLTQYSKQFSRTKNISYVWNHSKWFNSNNMCHYGKWITWQPFEKKLTKGIIELVWEEKDKDFLCNRFQLGVSENIVVKKKLFDICNRSKSYIELFVLCRFSIDSWFSGWHSCKAGQSKYDWHQNWMICSHYKKKSWTNMFEWRKDYVWFYKIHFGYSNRSIICHKL